MTIVLAYDIGRWLSRLAKAHNIPLDRPKWAIDLVDGPTGRRCILINSSNAVRVTFEAGAVGLLRVSHNDALVVAAMRGQAGLPSATRNRSALAHTQEAFSV